MKTLFIMFLSTLALVSNALGSQSTTLVEEGKDYYVSQERGRGRKGTKEMPAKDLAAIASFLQPGDRVHIAAGKYISKAGRGTDIIKVPISIIGGYNSDFSARDPWGKYQTILTGTNSYEKAETTERLAILTDRSYRNWAGKIRIDGIIVDNGPRNRYKTDKRITLLRKASPIKQEGPTPGNPGIKVRVGATTQVEVVNCVVINCGSSQGAIEVQLGREGKGWITNNLVVNNTGEGIFCKTNYHSNKGMPEFLVKNNTVLFSWTYDGIASYGGSGLMMDATCKIVAEDNVFAFGDVGGVNNVKANKNLTISKNLFFGNGKFDYREFRSDLPLDELEDYAEYLDPNSIDNFSKQVAIPVEKKWADLYFNRTKISRAEIDDAVTVANSDENQLRSMLGLNLQGSTVSKDADIWLHQMDVADALPLGFQQYEGVGCIKPNIP